jgi:hypothetical protein
MFEQDMMENLKAMKVAAQKQKALVATVLRIALTNKNVNKDIEKTSNLMDQIAEFDLIVESIDEIFRSAKYLKEFQEKFEKL